MKNIFYKTCIAVLISYSGLQAQDSRPFDFYLSNLQQLDLSHYVIYNPPIDWTDEGRIANIKEWGNYGSYDAGNNQEFHYLTYCANSHKGFAILFDIKNHKPELLYKEFDLGCISNPRIEDIDGDGIYELIFESGGGGTGVYCKKEFIFFSQDVSKPFTYQKSCGEYNHLGRWVDDDLYEKIKNLNLIYDYDSQSAISFENNKRIVTKTEIMKFVNNETQDFDYVIDNIVKEYIETGKWKLVKCFTELDNYNCTLEKLQP